ncbi:DUF3887 domain-containing protein [Luteimonas aestuarii]|uniref:DUF3887 domain-containing protein n=1 Tax=Luteimonas aestuarii TaxID=453837 RepID=A0A4R5TXQ7_9GAMM|nr:DUF3887 domain-containing protein [Luteimonas aestuarii]TDK25970.1 DUF3887 domain-containing protein [Luteimonas aestuarii]
MNALRNFTVALCLGLFAIAPAFAQEDSAAIATASAVLDQMEAGDFEAASGDFNDNLKAQIDAVQLAGVQLQIESAGAVQSRGEPLVSERDGFTVVVYRIQREHAAIDATVAIDGDGKVAGLHFAPATAPAAQ